MKMSEWFEGNKEAARVAPDLFKIALHEKEYDDMITLFKTLENMQSDAQATKYRACVETLKASTEQLEAMNCSVSHAASWIAPRSDQTIRQVEINLAALAGVEGMDCDGRKKNGKGPNPGSDEAITLGCTCPILDNNHGRGTGPFWMVETCPLHGKPAPDAGGAAKENE